MYSTAVLERPLAERKKPFFGSRDGGGHEWMEGCVCFLKKIGEDALETSLHTPNLSQKSLICIYNYVI